MMKKQTQIPDVNKVSKQWFSEKTDDLFDRAAERIIEIQDVTEAVADSEGVDEWPHVILLNGPAGSGKTYIGQQMQAIDGLNIRYISTMEEVYATLRAFKLPETHRDYHEFKRLPQGRERLIRVGNRLNELGGRMVTNRFVTLHAKYRKPQLVVVDNVGYAGDYDWFQQNSVYCTLLQIRYPANLTSDERRKFDEETGKTYPLWPNDSRRYITPNRIDGDIPHRAEFFDSDAALNAINVIIDGDLTKSTLSPHVLLQLAWAIEPNYKPRQGGFIA